MNMEISMIIAIISVSFSILFGISNLGRNSKKDHIEYGEKQTLLIVKLETISEMLSELKREFSDYKNEVKRINSELIKLTEHYHHNTLFIDNNKAEINGINQRLIKAEASILELSVKVENTAKKCKSLEYEELYKK